MEAIGGRGMIQRFRTKWLLGLTTFVVISLTFSQFQRVFQFNREIIGVFWFGWICLAAVVIPWRIGRYVSYFCLLFVTIFSLVSFGQTSIYDWLVVFQREMVGYWNGLLARTLAYLPDELAVMLIVLVAIILIELVIEHHKIMLATSLLVAYLLLLAIYNRFSFAIVVLIIVGLGCFQKFLVAQQVGSWSFGSILRGTVVITLLAAISSAAFYFPKSSVVTQLVSLSSSVRTQLNTHGFYNWIEQGQRGGQTRTGFSENDQQLGGPLLDDETILFEAWQTQPNYWRVESKDLYTGQGWSQQLDEEVIRATHEETYHRPAKAYSGPLGEKETVTVTLATAANYLALPYGQLAVVIQNGAIGFEENPLAERLDFLENTAEVQLAMTLQRFEYTITELEDQTLTLPENNGVDYLQLPEALPLRVSQLAEEWTQAETTLIGKVLAVEEQLQQSGAFRYSKVDAAFIEENQDYVDQFLFEAKVGYCDNFSSAMTVLLRTLGIPARWTKGFAPGQRVASEGDRDHYLIRNKDAHAWVEVYFEDYGWLPFEPTPSFSQPLEEELETSLSTEEVRQTVEEQMSEATTESSSNLATTSATATEDETNQEAATKRLPILSFVVLLGLLLIGFLVKDFYFILVFLCRRFFRSHFTFAYRVVLYQINRRNKRQPSEPLLRYAQRVEAQSAGSRRRFIESTQTFERLVYGGAREVTEAEWEKLEKLAKWLRKKQHFKG